MKNTPKYKSRNKAPDGRRTAGAAMRTLSVSVPAVSITIQTLKPHVIEHILSYGYPNRLKDINK